MVDSLLAKQKVCGFESHYSLNENKLSEIDFWIHNFYMVQGIKEMEDQDIKKNKCRYSTTVSVSGFQPEDVGSIPIIDSTANIVQ